MGGMKRNLGFTLIELLIVISILVILAVSVAMGMSGHDYDARYSTTKSNLSIIRSAIALYRSRHSNYPKPSSSGGKLATMSGEGTLEAILTNLSGMGDGTEYVRGNIAGELLSQSRQGGNSYVCIVEDVEDYYQNQADYSGCENPSSEDNPGTTGGGYVYCPVNGAIRLNFTVEGEDFRTEKQFTVQELLSDWEHWGNSRELVYDWPVRW